MNVSQFLTAYLEAIAFDTSVVATTLGVVALLLVGPGWSWICPRYRESWAKIAVALFRFLAALSAVATKLAPAQAGKPLWEQPWAGTVLIAAVGYLLWEVAGATGDYKYKLSKEQSIATYQTRIEEANQDKKDAVYTALRLNWLLTHLNTSISERYQRVRRVTQAHGSGRVSMPQVRNGLAPNEQVHILLELLASLLLYKAIHDDRDRYNQNFRVGLFADRDGRLEPLDAFDLTTRDHQPFSSYAQYADRYRLDNDINPSHAVRCVREGRTLIVPSCDVEPGFEFFHDQQRSYLKSMIAHPLSKFPSGRSSLHGAV